MSSFFEGLKTRFTDPGSIRSLVLAIFMFKGIVLDPGVADVIVNTVVGGIATLSFFMKPKAVVAVEAVTAQVNQAAAVVKDAAADAATAADKLQGVLGNTR